MININRIIIFLCCILCFSCKKDVKSKVVTEITQNELVQKNSLQVSNDTLFINSNVVLSVKLDSLKIEKLKKKYKSDFFVIMDDANNYKYEAAKYLESKKIIVHYFSQNVIAYLINNEYKFLNLDEIKSPLNLLFYKKNHPIREVVPIDVNIEYEEYFENK